ncbi:MAG: PEP-CTERM system histidine kinase PrsK [Pseudomonadales bacterium]
MSLDQLYQVCIGLGLMAYAGLFVFCIATWLRRITGLAALLASAVSLAFLTSLAATGSSVLSFALELSALLCWMLLVARIIGLSPTNAFEARMRPVTWVLSTALVFAAISIAAAWTLQVTPQEQTAQLRVVFGGQVLVAIAALVLLEQVVRNTRDDLRWRLRYLTIGLGTLFGFELVHSACGLLFSSYLPWLLVIQPAVFGLAAPFIAIASLRNPRNRLRANLSRRFVFRSGVLIASGLLLLMLGGADYFARMLGGDWAAALLALSLTISVVVVLTLVGSERVRARLRRVLTEQVFASRYDYRAEWRRVTEELTEPSPDFDLAQQAIRALAGVLNANGGGIWRRNASGLLVPLQQLHTTWNEALTPETSSALIGFFGEREWVLDLQRLPEEAPEAIARADDLRQLDGLRVLIPLVTESGVFGVVGINDPLIPLRLDWEDYTMLKLIGREAAGFLALHEADRELAESDRLKSFNQMSAFVVHDVKTVMAQLSLLLQNADKHRHNPAFIDDMIITVRNSVSRMQGLLAQFRDLSERSLEAVDIKQVLVETLAGFDGQRPLPTLQCPAGAVHVKADRSSLAASIGHLVQNAVQATPEDGAVSLTVVARPPWVEISVSDTGKGMTEEFVRTELFKPFASTKGVAGMGVGAYQARTQIRAMGGDLQVSSEPDRGTEFLIRLPAAAADE